MEDRQTLSLKNVRADFCSQSSSFPGATGAGHGWGAAVALGAGQKAFANMQPHSWGRRHPAMHHSEGETCVWRVRPWVLKARYSLTYNGYRADIPHHQPYGSTWLWAVIMNKIKLWDLRQIWLKLEKAWINLNRIIYLQSFVLLWPYFILKPEQEALRSHNRQKEAGDGAGSLVQNDEHCNQEPWLPVLLPHTWSSAAVWGEEEKQDKLPVSWSWTCYQIERLKMEIACSPPHTVSDVILNFEKSVLTPHYATVEYSRLAKFNFHTPTCYVPDFYFYF